MTGRDVTTMERMQCGSLSGLIAQTMTYRKYIFVNWGERASQSISLMIFIPSLALEVTRRRMQTIGIVPTSGQEAAVDAVGKASSRAAAAEAAIRAVTPTNPPSMNAIVKELYEEQGIKGFFKGVTMNWFKGPIAFSISFTVFDTIQGYVETEKERVLRLPRKNTTVLKQPNR